MKDYKDFMEALSMKDMKDLGGTAAQKKIAQDRQRRREAKNKGMGNPNGEPTAAAAAADKEKKEKGGAIVKKPDVRKSQLGKWAEGIKKAPKSSSSTSIEPSVEKVKVKVDDPKDVGNGVVENMKKKKAEKEAREEERRKKKRGQRSGKTNRERLGDAADFVKKGLQSSVNSGLGASESGDLEGLSGKQSYE